MVNGDGNLQFHIMVVGDETDDFVQHTIDLLEHHGIEFILCDDVYSAVSELTKREGQEGLIIGRVGQLSEEHGRFFHIARRKGHRCCCFVDKNSIRKRKLILNAIETGAFIINKPAEIKKVLIKLLEGNGEYRSGKKGFHRTNNFFKDEFITTRAELDALLEVQLDETP